MATIIDFQQAGTRSGSRPVRIAGSGSADVVMFPGVRYERYDERTQAASDRRQSRRRQLLELDD